MSFDIRTVSFDDAEAPASIPLTVLVLLFVPVLGRIFPNQRTI